MNDLATLLDVAKSVKTYLSEEGRTYAISKGKMINDEAMPADVQELLQAS